MNRPPFSQLLEFRTGTASRRKNPVQGSPSWKIVLDETSFRFKLMQKLVLEPMGLDMEALVADFPAHMASGGFPKAQAGVRLPKVPYRKTIYADGTKLERKLTPPNYEIVKSAFSMLHQRKQLWPPKMRTSRSRVRHRCLPKKIV